MMLKTEVKDNQLQLTLQRPEVRNAFNPELIRLLTKAFQQASKNKDLRSVLLRGEGKVFCAGADLNWMSAMVNFTKAQNKKDSEVLFGMFESIANCEIPVMAYVHGAAFGGALGLIACADVVIADAQTQFCFSEVKLGIAPAVISHFVLQKSTVGQSMPWMTSGEIFNAEIAVRLGLVHEIADATSAETLIQKWKLAYQKAGPTAVRSTKRLLKNLSKSKNPKKATTDLIAKLRVSSEGQDGLRSFLEKREPGWSR